MCAKKSENESLSKLTTKLCTFGVWGMVKFLLHCHTYTCHITSVYGKQKKNDDSLMLTWFCTISFIFNIKLMGSWC